MVIGESSPGIKKSGELAISNSVNDGDFVFANNLSFTVLKIDS
nr:hypothetical protein LSDV/HLJ_00098 [Lumpy skin disease virus]